MKEERKKLLVILWLEKKEIISVKLNFKEKKSVLQYSFVEKKVCLSVKSVAGHLVGLAGVGHLALPDVQRRLVDHGGDHQVHVDLV